MLGAMLMFSLNDTMGKWLVATYPVGELLLLRSAAGLLFLTPFLLRLERGALFHVERPKTQALRVFCSTAEVICFYAAVATLPLADVMTYWLAAPIYVAALSPLMLGERVGWRRWAAIGVGFLGVVVALDPSAATLTLPALISVVGSFLFALTMVYGRQLRGTPDTVLVFWHIAGAAVAGLVTVPFAWVTPDLPDFLMLSLLGVVAMLAHIGVNRALKLADAATVAPLQYTLLFWAILFGWLFFGEVPRTTTMIGAAIIVASGLYIVWRERQLGREPVPLDPS
ncbi:DMT family transporter [Aureimonas sp. SA4125]|uniref:DMT family transporter n=1 Tax=Aureimonas sp. SA4125 TaxID=2826993 RepID=UPI001CC5C421|nr:DMT family transporter [Aureimonas sp. SA4125]